MDLKKKKNEYYRYFTREAAIQAVQQNGFALRFVKNQTDEICRLAVQEDGIALQFVKNQINEICKLAVQQNCLALQYVNEDVLQETEELTLEEVCEELGRDIKIIKGDE